MWDTLSKILNVVLGLWGICLYAENRKLKGFKIDKEIKLKELEIEEVKRWYPKRKEELDNEMAERGLAFSGIREKANADLKKEYENKLSKLETELIYLNKLKRYKWIFSK
ncbi:MAG: hypothetical protein NT012_00330 [Candidatus Nealsonbacteria bacterium]|nr:hypothetical protein [Candidatus Nealsonbacteria bacterium]